MIYSIVLTNTTDTINISNSPLFFFLANFISPIVISIITAYITYSTTKAKFKNEQTYAYHKLVFEELISKLYEELYNLDTSEYNINKVVVLYNRLNSLVTSNLKLSNSVLDSLMQKIQYCIDKEDGYCEALNQLKDYVIEENKRLKKYLGYPNTPFKSRFYNIMSPHQRLSFGFSILVIIFYIVFMALGIVSFLPNNFIIFFVLAGILLVLLLVILEWIIIWLFIAIREKIKNKKKRR